MMTNKKSAFVQEYLRHRNATRAAKCAGHSEKTAYSLGSRLLKDVDVLAEIDRIVRERTMPAEEVLTRLSDQGRADMVDFTDENGDVDLEKVRALGLTHLIKKFKKRTTKTAAGVEETVLDLELYDAQGALELLAKHHALLVDRSEINLKAPKVLIWDIPEPPPNLKP